MTRVRHTLHDTVRDTREPASSAEACVAETIERIAALNPMLNAFITVLAEEALSQARVLDRETRDGRSRGPLHGRTISLKDVIDVRGVPTTAASRVRAGHRADADAPLVARIRDAGGIIIGKCNLHEFAIGTTSEASAYGPVRHPRDPRRSPGGSSGGSGAAVAAGLGWASIGSDTGGSIRIPAAACGVVGLKPALGEIPTAGVVPVSPSLDHVGWITRTVGDAWTLYETLTGIVSPALAPAPLAGVVLGRLDGFFLERLDRDVRQRFAEALERLQAAGASIVDAQIPHASAIPSTYVCIAFPEAAAHHATTLDSVPDQYTNEVRTRLEWGRRIPADDYRQAQRDRTALRHEVDAALSQCDALVLPTLPIPAPLIGQEMADVDGVQEPLRPLMLRLTQLFNLTGHPAISIPCGETRDGLPCGLQMAARRRETARLLSLALACERHVTP